MQDGVCVLLVSVGSSPSSLESELSNLGVRVIVCSMAEAEQHVEDDAPDLVALFGGRGAMELATLLDDQEEANRPKMVIVAERRDLAKLRGLNREIVVSLFALETTEKVVGQRIESLARRAARSRGKLDEAVPKKTALGLPTSAAAAAAAAAKNSPRKAPPRIAGNQPPARQQSPRPAEPQRVAAMPPPADVAEQESLSVSEDELVSLRPSEAPDAAPEPDIPEPAGMPQFDDVQQSLMSVPPTLPPIAKAQSSRAPDESMSDGGELDISGAEAALDNLDSVKLAITPDLVEAASSESASQSPSSDDPSGSEDDLEELSLAPDEPEESEGETQTVASSPSKSKASERSEMDAEPSLRSEADGGDAVSKDEMVVKAPSESARRDQDSPVSIAASGGSIGAPPGVNKGGGGGLVMGAMVLIVLGFGAAYFSGFFEEKSATSQVSAPRPAAEVAASSPGPGADSEATSDSGPKSVIGNDHANPSASSSDSNAVATSSSEAVDNPFLVEDRKKPSCEQVLSGEKPVAGEDPVHEASLTWAEARKLIVSGKSVQAHRKMCEAVSLNPESAAIEGLVQYYLNEYSPREALKWIERADKYRPGQVEMGFMKGDAHSLMGDTEGALRILLATLNISADETSRIRASSKDYSVEAGRHLRRGDLNRAERFFRRAITLDPENLSGVVGLARTFHKAGLKEHARGFCLRSLKVSDVIPEVHVLLGDLARESGKANEARSRYERALEVRPDFFPAKRGLRELTSDG